MLRDCSSLQKTWILEPHNCGNETLSNELTATLDNPLIRYTLNTNNILLKAIMNHSTNTSR